MARLKRVVVESPYSGDTAANASYARWALRDSIERGEAPLASHLLYPGALNEDHPDERALGIECGFAWLDVAELQVFYTDRGWSKGMMAALKRGRAAQVPHDIRAIFGVPTPPPDFEESQS